MKKNPSQKIKSAMFTALSVLFSFVSTYSGSSNLAAYASELNADLPSSADKSDEKNSESGGKSEAKSKASRKKTKIIGVTSFNRTLDDKQKLSFSMVKLDYVKAINTTCSDLPIVALPIPVAKQDIEKFSEVFDGIVISSTGENVPPSLYGKPNKSVSSYDESGKIEFEVELMKKYIPTNKPVLGISTGMQVINIVKNGDIMPIESGLTHSHKENPNVFHDVEIDKQSKLYKYLEDDIINVNSRHSFSVGKIGDGLAIAASADDGVVEAIEDRNHTYLLGVQWNPEGIMKNEHSKRIIRTFCESVVYGKVVSEAHEHPAEPEPEQEPEQEDKKHDDGANMPSLPSIPTPSAPSLPSLPSSSAPSVSAPSLSVPNLGSSSGPRQSVVITKK